MAKVMESGEVLVAGVGMLVMGRMKFRSAPESMSIFTGVEPIRPWRMIRWWALDRGGWDEGGGW